MSKFRLLLIDDIEGIRNVLKSTLENNFDCCVEVPSSFAELKKLLLTEKFDGILIDIKLDEWKNKDTQYLKMGNIKFKDGADIASYFEQNYNHVGIGICSGNIGVTQYRNKINKLSNKISLLHKPIPHNNLQDYFSAICKSSESSRIFNSKINSFDLFKNLSENEKIMYYKDIILNQDKNNYFEETDNNAWALECGYKISANDLSNFNLDKIDPFENTQNIYPTDVEIIQTAEEKSATPLPFWNFKNDSYLKMQHHFSGDGMKNIPLFWQPFFEVSVAQQIGRHFIIKNSFEDNKNIIKDLDLSGKIEVPKYIINNIKAQGGSESDIQDSLKLYKKYSGIEVIDHFDARIAEIEGNTAWVMLQSIIEPNTKASKPFNYETLKLNGVRHKESRFKFSVVKQSRTTITSEIEPILVKSA